MKLGIIMFIDRSYAIIMCFFYNTKIIANNNFLHHFILLKLGDGDGLEGLCVGVEDEVGLLPERLRGVRGGRQQLRGLDGEGLGARGDEAAGGGGGVAVPQLQQHLLPAPGCSCGSCGSWGPGGGLLEQLVAGEGLLEALHGAVAVAALLQLHHPRHRLGLALRHRLLHNLHTQQD